MAKHVYTLSICQALKIEDLAEVTDAIGELKAQVGHILVSLITCDELHRAI